MRTFGVTLAGLVGGFILGIVLSEVIAVTTALITGRPAGVSHLPVYTGPAGGVLALAVRLSRRDRSRTEV
ncbi:hypothetical protein C1I98_17855 [Spongiactinospora gelatinilytica]|uniref:Uncharacterized protein n=1 Tax=Spongiactinospora gelatinilytica TaxID=2666298 RepID=A0A2W2HCL0_9ACTN|nr:DUF5957 family protein [Spongiactinospora gelatinilytica]PZG43967.1 hypothetical protein C1I98_17855 [Spongiactinospora gelatinilytica]